MFYFPGRGKRYPPLLRKAQTGSGTEATPFSVCFRGCLPLSRTRGWVKVTTVEVQECVELYLHSLNAFMACTGHTLLFLHIIYMR